MAMLELTMALVMPRCRRIDTISGGSSCRMGKGHLP